jgi:hypothetical protein
MPSLVQKLFGFLTNDPLEDKKQQAQSPSSTSKSPNSYDKLQQQQQLHQPPQSQYHGPGAYIWPPTNQNYVGSFSEQQQQQQLQLQQQQFMQAGYGPQPPAQLPPHRPPQQQPSHISNSVHRTSQVNSRDASPSLRLTQHDTPPPLPSPDHPSLPPMPWLTHDVKSGGAGSHVSTPSPTSAEKEGTMVEYESPGRKQRRSALDSVSHWLSINNNNNTSV